MIIVCSALLTAFMLFSYTPLGSWFTNPEMREAIIFFPEDDQVSFVEQGTEIQLLELKDANEYYLEWQYYSLTDTPVYLRQDVSLLFENGMLVDKKWTTSNTKDKIKGKSIFKGEDSGRHEAISFHYAEIHYPEDIIKSKRAMSSDILYIIDSPLSPIMTFKEPNTTMEQRSKELLDSIIDQQLSYVWDGLIEEFQINQGEYLQIPFNEITKYETEPLYTFTMEETSNIIGKLWESLYRHYILGINTFNDKEYDPIGNTLPLILLHEGGDHIIILYETGEQTKQQILQHIDVNK